MKIGFLEDVTGSELLRAKRLFSSPLAQLL